VGDWQFLACGIDTLDLGVSVDWGPLWHRLHAELASEKEQASGKKGGVLSADGQSLTLASGKPPNYRYHRQFPEFHFYIGISREPHGKTPNVYVSINSQTLWESPLAVTVALIRERIEALGGRLLEIKPSRFDLAADFRIPAGLSLDFLLAHRVPQDGKHSHNMEGVALQTFYHGAKKSPIQLRIYDKGLEIQQGVTKPWFLSVWNLLSPDQVWRAEFQLRRKALHEFQINSLDDLNAKVGGVWQYLTDKWFSLRLPDDSNTTRRTVHPWWQSVQACADRFGPALSLRRDFEGEPADSSWYVQQGAAFLKSFAALEGLEDFDEAGTLYFARMRNYWRPKGFTEAVIAQAIRLGHRRAA